MSEQTLDSLLGESTERRRGLCKRCLDKPTADCAVIVWNELVERLP